MSRNHHTLFNADARFAVRPAANGGPTILAGYAMIFGAVSSDRGGYRVRFLAGCPTFTPVVRALWDHDRTHILGRNDTQTLRYFLDATGIGVEIDLPDTSAGRDVAELVRRRDIQGMSFGVADWPPDGKESSEMIDGRAVNVLNVTRCLIDEVTVTGDPAFVESSIDVKRQAQHAAARAADYARFDRLRFQNVVLPPIR